MIPDCSAHWGNQIEIAGTGLLHILSERKAQRTAGIAGAGVPRKAVASCAACGDPTDHARRDGRMRRKRVVLLFSVLNPARNRARQSRESLGVVNQLGVPQPLRNPLPTQHGKLVSNSWHWLIGQFMHGPSSPGACLHPIPDIASKTLPTCNQ